MRTATEEMRATASEDVRMTIRGRMASTAREGSRGITSRAHMYVFLSVFCYSLFLVLHCFHITRRGKQWWEEHQPKQGEHQCR